MVTDAATGRTADSAASTAAGSGDPVAQRAAERAEIDRIDEAIIALIRERCEVFARIRQARLTHGGARVDIAREQDVFSRYGDALGRSGTAVAHELLILGRGQ